MKKLVIVESPAKARTIEKYLGGDFKVAASVGHVVDLPRKDLGVDIEHDFKPRYEVMPEKKKAVESLKKLARGAEEIYLAPDPDREGEAIAWHIANILKKAGADKPMHRMLINEITKPGVIEALKTAGRLDKDRFEAQQARRILDRLVGYLISPLLSKKFRTGLSAGRVQSVALRLVVEREREIAAFKPQEYWSIDALLEAAGPPKFKARLAAIEGKSLEPPGDRYHPEKHTFIPDQQSAKKIIAELRGKDFIAAKVTRQERKRNPAPPFITSTLQQEAARKLGFSAKKTMTLAQRLYEGQDVGQGAVGLITYMRTDSPRLSDQALEMAREHIVETYGKDYLPDRPVKYKSKKGAQEAHEAIRPTSTKRAPEMVAKKLDRDMARLYELVFNRFIASQMKPALYDQTAVEIPVENRLFRASGRVLKFKGFLAVYVESTDDEAEDEDKALPEIKEGDRLDLDDLVPEQHFTKPPPRYTEASLVKELEEKGVGRPSTYAQILSTIEDRKYVEKDHKRFLPTPLGELVNDVLVEAFPDIIDVGFTAQMEDDLDKVEEGRQNWVELLRRFYGPFEKRLNNAGKIIDKMQRETPTGLPCPVCGREMMIKLSTQGEFLGCSGYPECRFTCDFERKDDDIVPLGGEVLEIQCPRCGKPLQVKTGKLGEFVGCTGYPDCTFTSSFQREPEGKIKLAERETEETGIKCKECGSPMVIKHARRSGKEFLACSAYPKCKNAADFMRQEDGTIKIVAPELEPAGIECEKCGKPMVVRKTRKTGREFLGCSGFPECKNAKDFIREPDGKIRVAVPGEQGELCIACGKPMVIKKARTGSFWACTGYPECKQTKPLSGEARIKDAPRRENKPRPMPDEPPCEKCGKPMVQRQGRYGPFIACSGYPRCKNIRKKKGASRKAAKKKTGAKKKTSSNKSLD